MSDENKTTALERRPLSMSRYEPPDLRGLCMLAKIVVESSLAPKHVRTWQDAMLIMKRGAELGLPTQMALENIFVISGKTSMYADCAVALVKGRGHRFDVVESTDEKAVVKTVRDGYEDDGETYSSGRPFEYSIGAARKAGWTSNKMYSSIPRNMLLARAKMELARMVYEDLLSGVVDPTEILHLGSAEVVGQVAQHYGDNSALTKVATPAPEDEDVIDAEYVEPPDEDGGEPEALQPDVGDAWMTANKRYRAVVGSLDAEMRKLLHEAFLAMAKVDSSKDLSPNAIQNFATKLDEAADLEAAATAMIKKYIHLEDEPEMKDSVTENDLRDGAPEEE